MYRIEFANSAAKEFRGLPAEIKRRMAPVIDGLVVEPRPHDVRKLAGHEKLYRVRVGQYRIIYELDDERMLIRVTRVRHRRDAYR
jgi:mRNA interferase RelE/StbE